MGTFASDTRCKIPTIISVLDKYKINMDCQQWLTLYTWNDVLPFICIDMLNQRFNLNFILHFDETSCLYENSDGLKKSFIYWTKRPVSSDPRINLHFDPYTKSQVTQKKIE